MLHYKQTQVNFHAIVTVISFRGSVQGEQLHCHIGDSRNTPVGAIPGRHIWGTPCAINTVNIKVSRCY